MTVGELREFLKDVSDDAKVDFIMGDTSQSMLYNGMKPLFTSVDKNSTRVGIGVSVDIDGLVEDRRYDTVEDNL